MGSDGRSLLLNKKIIAFLIYVIAAIAIPLFITDAYYLDVLIKATIYLCMAVSLSVVIGHLGMLSLAHPAFLGIGAYTSALFSLKLGWPILWCMLMGGVVAALIALLVALPLMKLTYHAFAIGSLAFLIIMRLLALNWEDLTRGPLCLYGLERPRLAVGGWVVDFNGDMACYYLILLFALVTIVFTYLLIHSRFGRALNAIREDETLAVSSGVYPYRYKIITFALTAIFPGLAGAFLAHYINVVCPRILDFYRDIYLLIMVIVGGATSLAGVIFSSYLFTYLPEAFRLAKEYRDFVYGLTLIIFVIYMPRGIWPTIEAWFRRRQRRLSIDDSAGRGSG